MRAIVMADLADLVPKHQVNLHSFADDSQMYLHCRISEASSAVSQLEDCIFVIGHMSANNNNNNNTSICKAHNVSIRAESEAPLIV